MFSFLGKMITRGWPVFLTGWVLLTASVFWTAPTWHEVADDREFGFLPDDCPSRVGEQIFHKAFPQAVLGSNVVLVVHREVGKLAGADYIFIDKVLKPALMHIVEEQGGFANSPETSSTATSKEVGQQSSGQPIISKISTAKDPGTGPLLISADHKATLVVVDLTTEFMESRNWPTVQKIEHLVAGLRSQQQVPSGLTIDLTGSATVGRDIGVGQGQSASATGIWTVVMVVGLLLLIYRAPLVAIVPLVTLFVAIQVSLKLLSLLATAGAGRLFEGIEIYITIILYGAGVDYCLFMIARYREELDNGQQASDALAGTIAKIGGALAASAATVMFGIGMMAFADFGKFHYAGLAIFFSLFIALCAVLTLAAPLLRLTGKWIFWPKMPQANTAQAKPPDSAEKKRWSIWEHLARWLVRRPVVIWLTCVALMTPFVVIALTNSNHVNYDLLERLPSGAPGVVGTRALQEHFPSGVTGPVTVLLINPHVDFRAEASEDLIKKLADGLREHQEDLSLTDVRCLANPLGITDAGRDKDPPQVAVPFGASAISLGPGSSVFDPGWSSSLGGGLDLGPKYQKQKIVRQRALEHYVSLAGDNKGHVTQLELLVAMNPLSRAGAARLERLEQTIRDDLPPELAADSEIHAIGPTASIRDLINVTGNDEVRVKVLVTGCVWLILMVLLRKLVVSMYLVATVLFSFFTTLGVTYGVFWVLDPRGFPGLDWKVSVLLFTVLVAVGEDYNIFLMTRIDEEQKNHADNPVEGITQALVKTGGIITSCGLIMAGTFASLLFGSLVDLQQLGLALAFGVLLDTFIVRPVLVPAFLILLSKHGRAAVH